MVAPIYATIGKGAVAALLLAGSIQAGQAHAIVDIDRGLALGTVVVDSQRGEAWFSLGNGRAIGYTLAAGAGRSGVANEQALLKEEVAPQPAKPMRRNIRWEEKRGWPDRHSGHSDVGIGKILVWEKNRGRSGLKHEIW